jgi:choline dehydrogenase-like flavoprotein
MIVDARTLPVDRVIDTDVCIVGAGAAGITLAHEFIGRPFRVCLLESGGLEFEPDVQSLHDGSSVGHPYRPIRGAHDAANPLASSRLRFFGGTTNHWAGWCRPFDDLDFGVREWIPHSGWPFGRAHLDPFYRRAHAICQLGPATYDVEAWESADARRLPFVGDRVMTRIFQVSPPTRFGVTYRPRIAAANNLRTLLHASAVEIESTKDTRRATRVRVATLNGNVFFVSARVFILAAGGIENARLLLASNRTQAAGLGNRYDLVGRFFMEHQEFEAGRFLASGRGVSAAFYQSHQVSKARVRGRIQAVLTLSSKVMETERLVNFTCEVEPVAPGRGSRLPPGIESDSMTRHLTDVISALDDNSDPASGGAAHATYRLVNASEQTPSRDSRVTLSEARDALGMNRVRLDWRPGPGDVRSLRRAYEILGQELGRAGLGRLRTFFGENGPSGPVNGQCHHMGTTRMHSDPRQGVVDGHCRVHGVANLYIAGSSVFPTSGSATPTLTIVALAVRLADHVARELAGKGS